MLTVLGEAERFGAVCANRLEAVALLEEGGRARGARVRDARDRRELEIRAANVVNATGVWADRLRPGELHDEAEVPVIRPSRGTHSSLARRAAADGGGRDRARRRRRARSSSLPWLGQTLIGTTDNDYEGDLDHVQPAGDDVDYLLDAVNAFFATDARRPATSPAPTPACGR